MNRRVVLVVLVIGAVLACRAPADAALRSPQVTLGGSEAPTLQTVFNNMMLNDDLFAYGDQVGNAMFNFTNPTTATMLIEVAGNANSNTLGLYDGSFMKEIFAGSAAAGAKQTINFDSTKFSNYGGISLDGGTNWYQMSATFGFYMGTSSQGTFYTQDVLNYQQKAHALVYTGDGQGNDLKLVSNYSVGSPAVVVDSDDTFNYDKDFIFAWEDLKNGDWDYQDMVVYVTGIKGNSTGQNPSVPEPTAILVWSILAGSGCGLAAIRRRRGWSQKNRQQINQIFQG